MVIVLAVAAAAALVVVAYHRLRQTSPQAGTAGLQAVRDLADVVLVCVKAIEGVVDVLTRPAHITTPRPRNQWAYSPDDEDDLDIDPDLDLEDEQL
ncbi:hypothetical protein N865_20000 [Intrasporangium oryzae NRRL B-24470]|uniref:Uncharacterized protein n=1 Tax=Intrasporangium oryzae NRRL B-24470 TaxID=1386089 RepID=W9G1P9_9MICO|nr:hypothetical protein [Intrasporangium oryzae]EWS99889.1 hypothetical protein N865_20000 [Intrasporangium oryzae NRRL B-24470]